MIALPFEMVVKPIMSMEGTAVTLLPYMMENILILVPRPARMRHAVASMVMLIMPVSKMCQLSL